MNGQNLQNKQLSLQITSPVIHSSMLHHNFIAYMCYQQWKLLLEKTEPEVLNEAPFLLPPGSQICNYSNAFYIRIRAELQA
jgi:hypothetical protein